jgi:hypothetical protein
MSVAEIEAWYESEWAIRVLGDGGLVPSDSHEENEENQHQPLMTEGKVWYFVPRYDDPVVATRTIRPGWDAPVHHTGRPRWGVEVLVCHSNYPHEPDDYDFKELGRADSLLEAIALAAHAALDDKLQGIGEGLYYEKEVKLQPHIEDIM